MTTVSEPGAFVGVILAAGKGRRIQPFSDRTPKPLLPVLDRPLIAWQIEAMRDLGVQDIVIVIGHLGHYVVQALGDGSRYGVRLRYVEQEKTLGIAHAVAQLEAHVDRPFLLFLGDIFFETDALAEMLRLFGEDGVDGVLAVKREDDPDAIRRNFTVDLDDGGFVKRVIEKPRHPRTNLKGCGLYLFDPSFFDAVRHTPRTALRDEYELTDAIQIFIDYGYGVRPADVVRSDLNLSEPADLLQLNLHALSISGHDRFVSEAATVDPAAVVERSVVLAGAEVPAGARLERCLVLPDERVFPGHWSDVIFLGGEEIVCHP
jgi:dTDP-glucose pyrophosphorylase